MFDSPIHPFIDGPTGGVWDPHLLLCLVLFAFVFFDIVLLWHGFIHAAHAFVTPVVFVLGSCFGVGAIAVLVV
jgi:hypothetical protein